MPNYGEEPSTEGMSLLVGTRRLENADIDHRASFVDYVMEHAEEWHRTHLTHLYECWEGWNEDHFASQLWPPYIQLAEPSNPRRFGQCGPVSGFGGKQEIRLRPSLLTGTHPRVNAGSGYAHGRTLFVDDVLLHEMIHQWQQEISGKTDEGYHGHGPAFRNMANVIGARLGLGRVRTSKERGEDKDLPSCSYWPHIVRPKDPDYYQGAYVPASGSGHKTVPLPIADIGDAVAILLQHYDPHDLCQRLLSRDKKSSAGGDGGPG